MKQFNIECECIKCLNKIGKIREIQWFGSLIDYISLKTRIFTKKILRDSISTYLGMQI